MIISTVGGADSNSYATIEEATDYFSTQLHRDSWSTLASGIQGQSLITATSTLDYSCDYNGDKSTEEQALQWPRDNSYCDGYLVPNTIIPEGIKVAVYELAFNLQQNDSTVANPMAGYKQVQVGSLNVVADDSTRLKTQVPDYIWDIISCYAFNKNASTKIVSMWRA